MRQQSIKAITILSRGLPKTGQEIKYYAYDDGAMEAGWWLGTLNENNRTRFVEKEFVEGEPVIIDLATKLMWPKDISGVATDGGLVKNWETGVEWCNNLIYGGFFNWRLCNVIEFFSLVNLGRVDPCAFTDVFDNWPASEAFWASSTWPGITTYAHRVFCSQGYSSSGKEKIYVGYRVLPCRSL